MEKFIYNLLICGIIIIPLLFIISIMIRNLRNNILRYRWGEQLKHPIHYKFMQEIVNVYDKNFSNFTFFENTIRFIWIVWVWNVLPFYRKYPYVGKRKEKVLKFLTRE